MNSIKRLLVLLIPFLPMMLIAALMGALTVMCNVGLLGTSVLLLSKASFQPPILDLMVLIVAVRFFGISRAIFRYVERIITHDITFKIIGLLRLWFYKNILPLIPNGIPKYSGTEMGNIITDTMDDLQNFYIKVLNIPLIAVVILLPMSIIIGQFSIYGSLVLIVSFVIAGVILPIVVWKCLSNVNSELIVLKTKSKELLADYIGGMVDLSFYDKVTKYQENICSINQNIIRLSDRKEVIDNIFSGMITLISYLAVLAVMILTVGRINPLYFGVIAVMILSSYEVLYGFPMAINELENVKLSGDSIFNLCDNNIVKHNYDDCDVHDFVAPDIKLSSVCFSYGEHQVLKGVSLDINYGSKIAIVGESGSGKSTMADLLVGFGQYSSGDILFNNIPTATIDPTVLRGVVGVMEQNPYIFSGTIKENILISVPTADDVSLISAAKISGIYDFVMSLPSQFNTYIGEGGYKLSGGQRHRLAMARVVLQSNPVIILDEISSGIDNVTLTALYDNIYSWGNGKTIINITHDASYLDQMDKVYLLTNGIVREMAPCEYLNSLKANDNRGLR